MSKNAYLREKQPDTVYTPGGYPDYEASDRVRNYQRKRIFMMVVAVSLVASLSWALLRAPVYESRAILLVTPPVLDERLGEVANSQYVELELHYLTVYSVLEKVAGALSVQDAYPAAQELEAADLDVILEAIPVLNTNLVEMTARGSDREILPVLINTWIRVYQQTQADTVASQSATDISETQQELQEMQKEVNAKRLQLDHFRKKYDIVSMERSENRMHKQLSGLTDALNTANAEMVSATAKTAAIRSAIREGKPVVSEHGKDSLTNLEQRLVEVQEQLKELEQEFTPQYMSIDPDIKGLVRKRDLLVREIGEKQKADQQLALAEAEQEQERTEKSVQALQLQLEEQKLQVMEFTTRFAEHEALQEELLQLETLLRDVQSRQLQNQVNTRQQYPRVEVKEHAFIPERPVYPDYLRDSALSVAGSVLLGLLVLGLYDFLNRSGRRAGSMQLSPVVVNVPGTPVLDQSANMQLPNTGGAPVLERPQVLELTVSDVLTLFKAADKQARLLITLTLSGLDENEVHGMTKRDISIETAELHVGGEHKRTIPVGSEIVSLLSTLLPEDMQDSDCAFPDHQGGSLDVSELAALLSCAANDAGLPNPEEVTLHALRHTYLAYLVRQGVKLSDLEKVTGYLPPSRLAAYTAYSPPGSGKNLDSVEFSYPALLNVK